MVEFIHETQVRSINGTFLFYPTTTKLKERLRILAVFQKTTFALEIFLYHGEVDKHTRNAYIWMYHCKYADIV